jgi:hypothetical protein
MVTVRQLCWVGARAGCKTGAAGVAVDLCVGGAATWWASNARARTASRSPPHAARRRQDRGRRGRRSARPTTGCPLSSTPIQRRRCSDRRGLGRVGERLGSYNAPARVEMSARPPGNDVAGRAGGLHACRPRRWRENDCAGGADPRFQDGVVADGRFNLNVGPPGGTAGGGAAYQGLRSTRAQPRGGICEGRCRRLLPSHRMVLGW